MKQLCATILAIVLLAVPTAFGDIAGFSDPGGFTLNANGAAAGVSMPAIVGDELQITSAANSQATSVFFNVKQGVEMFTAEFDYQLTGGSSPPADGAIFVIQNEGLNALGAGGGSRGYAGSISDSVAVGLNLWQNRSDIDAGLNGAFGARMPTAPVNIRSGNAIHTTVDYDGATITVGLEDLVTGDTFSTSWAEDIRAAAGAGTAYVGFSGGTGGANADQMITNFAYSGIEFGTLTWNEGGTDFWNSANWDGGPPDVPDDVTHAVLAATNTDALFVAQPASARSLTADGGGIVVLGGQTLSVVGQTNFGPGAILALQGGASLATGGGVISDLNATAGDATIDTSADLTVKNFLGNVLPSTAGTFTKAGAGTLSLDNSSGISVVAPKSTFNVEGGTLAVKGANPLGGAKNVTLAGGKLQVFAGVGTGVENELVESFYSGDATSLIDPLGPGQGYMGRTPLISHLYSAGGTMQLDLAQPDDWNIRSEGVIGTGDPNNFGAVWHGFLTVGGDSPLQAGDITFGTASDDGSTLFIDGQLVVDNNRYQGRTEDTETINLADGMHEITIGWYEGGGGANMEAGFAQGGGVGYGGLTFINPTDAAQAGLWTSAVILPVDLSDISVEVTAPGSALDPVTSDVVPVGPLTMKDGATLSTMGAGGINFASTTVEAGASYVGFDPQVPTDFAGINANGGSVAIAKTGSSTWVLDSDPVVNGQNSTWVVDAGALEMNDTAPLGGRPVTVNGGTLRLAQPAPGAANVTLAGGTLSLASVITNTAPGPAGALGHWALDEDSGTTAADSAGANTGTLMGGAEWRPGEGVIGGALALTEAGDQHVNVGSAIDLSNKSLTVSIWAKEDSVGGEDWLYGQGPTNGNESLHFGYRGNNQFALAFWGDDLNWTDPARDTEWHLWTGTFDEATKEQILYKDGTAVATRTAGGNFRGTGDMTIGRRANGGNWDGLVDDAYVYDSVLDPANIAAMAGQKIADADGIDVAVTASSTIDAGAGAVSVIGNLAIDSGVALTVAGGGTVDAADLSAGDGASVDGSVKVRSVLSVGDSVGTLDVTGDLTLGAGSVYEFEEGDLINVSGDLTVDDGWTLKVVSDQAASDQLLFTYGGTASVAAPAFDVSEAAGWNAALLAVVDDGAGSVSLTVIPEPGTLILLASGGLLLLVLRRRRK